MTQPAVGGSSYLGSQVLGTCHLNGGLIHGHDGAVREGHEAAGACRENSGGQDPVRDGRRVPKRGSSGGHCQGDGEESQLKREQPRVSQNTSTVTKGSS